MVAGSDFFFLCLKQTAQRQNPLSLPVLSTATQRLNIEMSKCTEQRPVSVDRNLCTCHIYRHQDRSYKLLAPARF